MIDKKHSIKHLDYYHITYIRLLDFNFDINSKQNKLCVFWQYEE